MKLYLLLLILLLVPFASASTLYVDINDGSCSDAYTHTQAQNSATPWCTFTQGLSGAESGDIILFAEGTYNQANSYSLSGADYATETTFKANEEGVIISNYISNFYTPSGNWNNQSSGIWNFTYSTGAGYLSVMRGDTNETLMLYTSYTDVIDTSLPEGCYFDTTPNVLWCRFDDTGFSPNDISMIVSKGVMLTLADVSNVRIEGMTFLGGLKAIYVSSASQSYNITIYNNSIIGTTGTSGSVGTGIIDIRGAHKVNLTNNYVEQKRSDLWDWTTTKGSPLEVSAIRFEDCYEDILVDKNSVDGSFNGIMFLTSSTSYNNGIIISNNNITDMIDDGIELESYGVGSIIIGNKVDDAFIGLSIIPYDSSTGLTNISYNIFSADKYNLYSLPSTYYYGEAIKLDGDGTDSADNILLDHNTFVGRGVYAGSADDNIMNDVNFTNNIFYSPTSQRILAKSGLASDGVFYDYNLYYRTDAGALFKYWNDDTSTTEFSTLSSALASGQWDGTWDSNSEQGNPSMSDYIPEAGNIACTMSSTGSYVGAVPCQLTPSSCSGQRGIICNTIGCYYELAECTESSAVRAWGTICTLVGCS